MHGSLDTVGLVIWPVKIVPEMTNYVSSGMLNPTHSHFLMMLLCYNSLTAVYSIACFYNYHYCYIQTVYWYRGFAPEPRSWTYTPIVPLATAPKMTVA